MLARDVHRIVFFLHDVFYVENNSFSCHGVLSTSNVVAMVSGESTSRISDDVYAV